MEEKRYIKRKEKALAEGNREQLAISCNHLGDHFNNQGKYQNAVQEYLQEAEIYNKLGKKLEMARAQRMVGEMFMLLSEFDNAKEHINIYLKTAKKLQNKVEEQRAYATLGRAHLLHGQSLSEVSVAAVIEELKQAEKAFLRSLLLIKELPGKISKLEQLDMQARCYLNIGVVKEHMGEFEESIDYMEKAIKISKSHDIFELTHLCYVSMSLLFHCKKNDPTLALRYCNLALEVAKRLPNKVKKICETLLTKSEILIKEGDFASAKQILTKAYKKNTPDENDRNVIERSLRVVVKICQTLDELVTTSSDDYESRKTIYERLGDGCCHLHNYEKALEYYQKMLECAELNAETTPKQLIPIYVSLYQTYKDNKQYDKALEYLWKEFELNKDNPVEAFSTLCTIGDVCELQLQPFWTVQDIYLKAKEQAIKSGDARKKLEKIVYARLKKLQLKHKMNTLVDELEEEAKSQGIIISSQDDDSDTESDPTALDNNTPELGDDVCLDDLTDSDTSDLDETEKPRPHRMTRGTRCLTIKRNNKGETQLHQACIAGNVELVQRLLDQGHVVNVRDHAGWIPLHEACNHGFRDIVEVLLNRGALVAINDKGGTSCDGITPLYDACSNGFLDVVELLLERGADVTVKTDFGETCLNALDKWRGKATLNDGEQAHYVQLRAAILKRLSKVGICGVEKNTPLTNSQASINENTYESNSCDDDDDDDEAMLVNARSWNRHNRSSDSGKALKDSNKKSPKTTNASLDYQSVMRQVKHPNRLSSGDDHDRLASSCSAAISTKQKRSALLDNEEVDPDSWLVDDIGPERKKPKHHTPTKQRRSSFNANFNRTSSVDNLNDSAFSARGEVHSLTPEMDAFEIMLDAASTSTAAQRQKQASKLRLSRALSRTSSSSHTSSNKSKPKQQASLLDSGFCRFRSESSLSSEDSSDAAAINFRTAEPDSTTTSIQLLISPAKKNSPIKVQATSIVPSTISFKIKVENELLLVPVERKKLNEINIRWLAEEAARRYYNAVGLKPVLRLKTSDGFAFEENDPVSVAIEENMILATVLEWKISPLPQRYEEMCRQLNKEKSAQVVVELEKAQVTNIINLNDFWLTPQMTETIFKSILHQNSLRVLDLSNNFIQNEGCRQLSKSLPTLKQLKTLNLRGNFITCDGLEILCSTVDFEKLHEFEELNLSQNPLGNSSIRILEKFCNSKCKTLHKLYLSSCGITDFYDIDLNFFNLTTFDTSYNKLSESSIKMLFEKLNCCRLRNLNLSFTIDKNADSRSCIEISDRMTQFFESGTCEKFRSISLAGCNLNDAHIYKISQCLGKSNDLELLEISENDQLTTASLKYIIQEISQLKKIVAINCRQLIDENRMQQFADSKVIPNFMAFTMYEDSKMKDLERSMRGLWHTFWGSKGKVRKCENHIRLYVNDYDIDCY